MVPLHAWLMPRALATAVGPWNEAITMDQDGEYMARVVLSSRRIVRAPRAIAYYRKQAIRNGDRTSTSSGAHERHHRGALLALDCKARELLARRDDARARRALARQYMMRAFLAHPRHPAITREAVDRANGMGVAFQWSPGFGPIGHRVSEVIGRRTTRTTSVFYHQALSPLQLGRPSSAETPSLFYQEPRPIAGCHSIATRRMIRRLVRGERLPGGQRWCS